MRLCLIPEDPEPTLAAGCDRRGERSSSGRPGMNNSVPVQATGRNEAQCFYGL